MSVERDPERHLRSAQVALPFGGEEDGGRGGRRWGRRPPPDLPRPASLRGVASRAPLEEGQTINGKHARWRIGPQIGQGGTAVVYETTSDSGLAGVAKVFSDHRFADSPEARTRFGREAAYLASVAHPNVVKVLDVGGGNGNGTTVLVLERADESLYDVLRRARGEGAPAVPLLTALDWLRQALAGAAALHAKGLVHRDLSPRNLLMFPGGRLAVADLGAVRHFDDATITGAGMGSLLYISPQQFEDPHTATALDDIFSLGQIGYELLTGRPPHGNPEALMVACADVPTNLLAAVESMRAYRQDQRPASAEVARAALKIDRSLAHELAVRAAGRGDFHEALDAMRSAYVGPRTDGGLIAEVARSLKSAGADEESVRALESWAREHAPPPSSSFRPLAGQPPRPYADLVEHGHAGRRQNVDFLMGSLPSADLPATKIIDHALGLVAEPSGVMRIDYYLFHGTRQQRNFAALYFKRRGDQARLARAVDAGAVDRVQAFSR